MSKRTQKAALSSPGRPPADSRDVRSDLLKAAAELFTASGYHAVSTKQIAECAGVNAAMINYYFGSKDGLHMTMLREAILPVLTQLQSFTDSSESQIPTLGSFIRTYMQTLHSNPWLPPLMIREVLPDNGRLRKIFVSEMADRVGAVLPAVVSQQIASSSMRKDLDPILTSLSLASLMVFPFLAGGVIRDVLGVELDDDLIDQHIKHTINLFILGTAP